MYKVKGTTLNNLGEIDKEFETLEKAEIFVKEMAIKHGVRASILETSECCKYEYLYNIERCKVMELLDTNGIKYKVDKFLNIKIEF